MKKYPRAAMAIALAVVLADGTARAANLYSSGTKTWDTTTANWGTAAGGPYDAATWNNANNDTAVFEGTAGTVTLSEGITVGGLSFDTAGYTITGNTLTFGVAGSVAANLNATISSILAGSVAITKAGAGANTLNGSAVNTFNGGLVLNGGTLLADFANLAAPTDLINSGNTLTLGGGTLSIKGKSSGTTSQAFGDVTVSAGGGQILGNKNGGAATTITLGTLTNNMAAGGSLLVGNAATTAGSAPDITTTSDKDAQGIYGGRIVFFNGTANTGYDWATSVSGASPYTLSAYGGYTTLPDAGGSSTTNYNMTAGITLTSSFSVNTLKLANPAAAAIGLSLGSGTLTVEGGGVLMTGSGAADTSITNGTLTAGSGSGAYDLMVHSGGAVRGLTIGAVIGDNGANAVNLVKAGPGRLVLSGANTYSGNTYANAGLLDFGSAALSGFGGGTGRNIYVAAGAIVRRNAMDNAFLNRLAETTDAIGIFTGTTANSFDFSGSTGANLPNAFLGSWASNSAKAEYSGGLTPAGDAYRFGFPGAAGTLGIVSALPDIGGTPRGLIVGGNVVELTGVNTFTGDTVIRTGGRLFLGSNLCLQNSALDLGDAGSSIAGLLSLETGVVAGKITGAERTDHPTLGGLKGSRNFASVISTANANNTGRLTVAEILGLTLNVGEGKTCRYTGAITEMAAGTYLTKTGAGTQVLAGINTYTGATTVSNGTLRLGADNALSAASPVVLAGGALDMGSFTNPLGTLAATGAGAIVLGAGSLSFLDSSGVAWPGTLTLAGTLGPQTVRFGVSGTALTLQQVWAITSDGEPVHLDADGYVVRGRGEGVMLIVR